MAKFAQYYLRYDLNDLFAEEYALERQKIFGSFFEKDDSIEFFSEKNGNKKVFKHQVYHLLLNRNIMIMRIANDKIQKVEQDFHEVDIKHEPSCYVIIDNRDNCRRIAIQKNQAFGSTASVANIIATQVSNKMKDSYNIGLELHPQFYPKDFYEAWRLKQLTTQRVRFTGLGNLPQDMSTEELTDDGLTGACIQVWEEAVRCNYRPVLELNPPESQTYLPVDEESTFIRNLVKLSATSGSPIELVTRDGMRYECFVSDDGESDKVVTCVLEDEYLDILFDADKTEIPEKVEQKIVEFVNGMKHTVDEDEKRMEERIHDQKTA